MDCVTFERLRELYKIDRVDFLKTDSEGGEYFIFTEENYDYLRRIPKIVGEWHLEIPEYRELFRKFRDFYLTKLPNFRVFTYDGAVDIKHNLWSERFSLYKEVLIYIDNR